MATYGDVKMLAEAKLGMNGCAFSEEELLFAMEHCLNTLAAQANPGFFNGSSTIPFVNGQNEYTIPANILPANVKTPAGGCLDSCNPDPCSADPVLTTPRIVNGVPQSVFPTSYTISGNKIVFDQIPSIVGTQTFKITGTRLPSTTFYVDAGATRTWQTIDLPPELTSAFKLCVQATLMLDVDPGQAANYYGLANDALKDAKKMKINSKGTFALYSHNDSCGCNSCCDSSFPKVLQFEG
jgi:hypothetical protein